MKKTFTRSLLAAGLMCFTAATSHAVVELDFTNINFGTPETGPNNTGGVIGLSYRATNAITIGGNNYDTIFEFANASVDSGSLIYVESGTGRGDDFRVILDKTSATDIWTQVDISFVESGTTNQVDLATLAGDNLRVQFDDLDSDPAFDRADFAGLLTSQIVLQELFSPTDLIFRTDLGLSGYTVGVIDEPYGPFGNITSNTSAAQAPVTAAFETTATTISTILGVTGPATGTRLIDIDMSSDVVPEASSFGLIAGLLALGVALNTRRRRA